MDNYYLVIVFVLLAVAAALAIVWVRRARTLPPPPATPDAALPAEPDVTLAASAGLIDPVVAIPPEAVGAPAPPPADVAVATPAAAAPAAGSADDLTTLKGLGPKAAARLAELGITRFDQLAALSADRLAAVDAQMGAFQGRAARDRWVEQAGHLAAGDVAGFEAKFGKLGG